MACYQAWQRRRAAREREHAPAGDPGLPYPILPSNTRAVMLFLTCDTQWRYAGDPAVQVGLDLAAVMPVMETIGIEPDARSGTLARLKVIENEAIRIFARRRSAEIARIRRSQRGNAPRGRR